MQVFSWEEGRKTLSWNWLQLFVLEFWFFSWEVTSSRLQVWCPYALPQLYMISVLLSDLRLGIYYRQFYAMSVLSPRACK